MTIAEDAVREVVRRLGPNVVEDPKRCRAALADFGVDRKIIAALAAVAEVRATTRAGEVRPGEPSEVRFGRLAREVTDQHATEPALARWAVEAWAYGLGETARPPPDVVPDRSTGGDEGESPERSEESSLDPISAMPPSRSEMDAVTEAADFRRTPTQQAPPSPPVASYRMAEEPAFADAAPGVPAVDDEYFPIEDYDELRINEIVPLLPELDDDELERVLDRESKGANRFVIIRRINALLGPGSPPRSAGNREPRKKAWPYGGGAVLVVATLVAAYVAVHDNSKKSVSTTNTTARRDSTTAVPQPSPSNAEPAASGGTLSGATPCPKADGASPRTTSFAKAPPMCIDAKKTYTATFHTSAGVVKVILDTKRTPMTANNFVVLSLYHYYDGTTFDRIDDSIDIIQGGSPKTQDITDPGPGYNIQDEGGKFSYTPGDLTMARGQAANSASAQYFFVTGAKGALLDGQGTYVTFGHTTAGLDVLQKVETTVKACPADGSDQGCLGGRPDPVVTVKTVTITAA